MNITKEKENGILTVSIEGELNIKTAPGLSQEIEGELDDVNEVHFDLKETRYISSSGLRVLLKTFQILDKKNGRMILKNVNEEFYDVLKLSGFTSFLEIEKVSE